MPKGIKTTPERKHLQMVWYNMVRRCTNPKNPSYSDYGGRGITVCEEWLHDPQSFIDWSLLSGYQQGLTIDRINNNKGYSPENCRWATRLTQQNNTRKNRSVTLCGETHNCREWARILGITVGSFLKRLNNGWSEERILNEPAGARSGFQKKPVLQYTLGGELVRRWASAQDIQRETGWWASQIGKCCNEKLETYKGFVWKHEN